MVNVLSSRLFVSVAVGLISFDPLLRIIGSSFDRLESITYWFVECDG